MHRLSILSTQNAVATEKSKQAHLLHHENNSWRRNGINPLLRHHHKTPLPLCWHSEERRDNKVENGKKKVEHSTHASHCDSSGAWVRGSSGCMGFTPFSARLYR
ncbi:hypothetical protein V6N11_054485 [Hibiscus sabdariffa]|uniref:Uncharacterized protein n=1 Tax=Hibiscus sabdariffa TaxID=183260 RepID=A0ABR2S4W7_9ROSI